MNAIPKMNPIRDEKYLKWLRDQPCILTGWRATEEHAVDPMHAADRGSSGRHGDGRNAPVGEVPSHPFRERMIMKDASEGTRMGYFGIKKCGCVVAVVVDDPLYTAHTAERVADYIARGLSVDRLSLDDHLSRLNRCKCPPSPVSTPDTEKPTQG